MLLAGPWWKRVHSEDWVGWGLPALAFVCALASGLDGFAGTMVAFLFWMIVLFVPYVLFMTISMEDWRLSWGLPVLAVVCTLADGVTGFSTVAVISFLWMIVLFVPYVLFMVIVRAIVDLWRSP